MRRFFPVILIAILASAMYVLNKGMSKNAVPDKDDDDDQQQQQSSDKPAPKAPATSGAASVQDPLPAEITTGDPTHAKYHVTFGWTYDGNNIAEQQQISQFLTGLQMWGNAHQGAASVEIVNMDVPVHDLSPYAASVQGLGLAIDGKPTVSVNGKPVDFSGNIGEGNVVPPRVMSALNDLVK